jgi:hypothetical protein
VAWGGVGEGGGGEEREGEGERMKRGAREGERIKWRKAGKGSFQKSSKVAGSSLPC